MLLFLEATRKKKLGILKDRVSKYGLKVKVNQKSISSDLDENQVSLRFSPSTWLEGGGTYLDEN